MAMSFARPRRREVEPAPWDTPSASVGAPAPWDVPDDDPAQLTPGAEEDEGGFFTLPNVTRVVGGVAGGVLGSFLLPGLGTAGGAAAGGAFGSGAGELVAEMLEVRRGQRQAVNPYQVGTQAAIGAVPLGKLGTVASGLVKGAALGAGSTVGSAIAEAPTSDSIFAHLPGRPRGLEDVIDPHGVEAHLPSMADVRTGAIYGGAFGGAASGILSRFGRPRTPDTSGPRLAPTLAPEDSAVRSTGYGEPRITSFERPRTPQPTDVDVTDLPFAHQPVLPMRGGRPGGRPTGAFNQGTVYPLQPRGVEPPAPWDVAPNPDVNPSLARPLLPSGLDPNPPLALGARSPEPELPDFLAQLLDEEPAPPISGLADDGRLLQQGDARSTPDGSLERAAAATPPPVSPDAIPDWLRARPPVDDAPFAPELESLLDPRRGLEPAAPGRPELGDTPVGWTGPERRAPGRMADEVLSDEQLNAMRARREATRVPKPPREDAPPTAAFAYEQEDWDGGPPIRLYNVTGGPLDGSSVSAATLRENGIPVPDEGSGVSGVSPDRPAALIPEVLDAEPSAIAPQRPLEELLQPAEPELPHAQVRPQVDDVDALMEQLGVNLDRVPAKKAVAPPTPTPESRLASLSPGDREGYARVPFPVGDDATLSTLSQSVDFNQPRLETIPLEQLVATQGTITRDVAAGKVGSPRQRVEQLPAGVKGAPRADVPTVYLGPDGTPYLANGTHEAVAAWARGDKDIQVVVYPSKGGAAARTAPTASGAVEASPAPGPVAPPPEAQVAPPQTTPRTPSPRVITGSGGPRVVEVDPSGVKVDAKTYQFKGGSDAQGVTDRLKGVESWDPIAGEATPIVTHRRLSGETFVVDGHQRLGLAKRLQDLGRPVPNLKSIELDEAAGVTPGMARRIGAMLNLQQGTGSSTDVAKVLREQPLSSAERARIPKSDVTGQKLRMGEDLAKLGDDAFLRVVNNQVAQNPARNEAFGAIVGRLVTGDAEQLAALKELAKAAPENAYEAEQFIRAIQSAGYDVGAQTNLFGSEEVATSMAGPIARVMGAVRRQLQSEKSALGNAVRNEDRLASRGNVMNRAANVEGAQQAGALDRLLDTYGHTTGPVREELKNVAAAVHRKELDAATAANRVIAVLERERELSANVRPDDAARRSAPPQQPEPPQAAPPVEAIPEIPPVPEATGVEAEQLLQQLAGDINVPPKQIVDDLPFALQQQIGKETAPPTRPLDFSEPAPAVSGALDDILPRHDVRNPAKVKEIAGSMGRVGFKGRPLLVLNDEGRKTAWTGTHRLAAAKEAGLTPDQVPQLEIDGAALRAAGYDPAELTKLGKKARIEALRASGQDDAARILEEEIAAKKARELPRARGTNPRAMGTSPRAQGKSPRQSGTAPRSMREAEELLDAGDVDAAEQAMSTAIEERIAAALKRGKVDDDGSTLYSGGFDPAGFKRLVSKHPESAWKAMSTAIGVATGFYMDEDHPGRGVLMGMMAGLGAGSVPRLVRALQQAQVHVGPRGSGAVAGPALRVARDPKKDIGLVELIGGTPERTIPEQFDRARPAYQAFLEALRAEHTRTGQIIPTKRVQALRDRHMSPVIAGIRRDARSAQEAGHTYKARYITGFANRLAGQHTVGQRVVQTLTKGKLPGDFVERRIAGNVYYVGTGYALDTALQNTTQPLMALAHVPTRFMVQAYKDLASNPAAKRLVEGALTPLEKPADAIEVTLGPFGQRMSKFRNSTLGRRVDPQGMLRWTDNKNREVVYYAGRKFAESQGMSDVAADAWAKKVMRKTQAEPGALGTNPFHAGPIAGSLRPFTKYPTVFTEHLVDLLKQAGQGENLAGAARFGGTIAGLTALGSYLGIDTGDLLVGGGRPLGLDPQHPQRSLERVASGNATPASRGAFDLLDHLTGSADHSALDDVKEMAIPRYARRAYEGVQHLSQDEDVHVTRGPGGKVRDVATPGETVLNLLGLRSSRQTDRRHALADFYETAGDANETFQAERRGLYEDLSRAIDAGDEDGARAAIRAIGSATAIKQFLKRRNQLPEERFFRSLPPKVRRAVQGAFDEAQQLAPEGSR